MNTLRTTRFLTRVRPLNTTNRLVTPRPFQVRTAWPARPFSSTTSRQVERRYVRFEDASGPNFDIRKWNIRTLALAGVGLGGFTYYVAHLEKVAETGRWRFMDVSPNLETKLAKAAREELIRTLGTKALPTNHPLTVHVRKVVTRLLEANNLGHLRSSGKPVEARAADDLWDPDAGFGSGRTEDFQPGLGGKEWELMVINDDSVVNAMAAYGDIVVFTGILPVAKDEEGLAAILGHEVAHVVARHNSERVSSTKVILTLITGLALLGLDFGLSSFLTNLFYDLPNSRNQEYEADQIGIMLMAKACYDPKAASEMFSRLAHLESKAGRGVEFLGTHPASVNRVQRLEKYLPQAYQLQAESPECARMKDKLSAFQDMFSTLEYERPTTVWRYA